MKKGLEQQQAEILKAVAQAWHGRSSGDSASQDSSGEFDARRRNFKTKATRFRIEASMAANKELIGRRRRSVVVSNNGGHWDFQQSLWDSYEIVSVSKKLETELNLVEKEKPVLERKRKESKNSLRNLFNIMSSRRFDESSIPPKEDTNSD